MRQECRYSGKISSYLDQELSVSEMNEIKMHLADCHDCRTRLSRFQAVSDHLFDTPEITPSSEFDIRFQEKLAATERSSAPGKALSEFIRPWTVMGRRISDMLLLSWRPYVIGAAAMGILTVFIFKNMNSALPSEELLLTENLEILQEYELLSELELFEYWDIIENEMPES